MLYFSRGNDAIPTEAWWPPPLDRPAGLSEPSPFSFEDDADHGVGLGARAAGALPQVVPKTLGAKRGMRGCRTWSCRESADPLEPRARVAELPAPSPHERVRANPLERYTDTPDDRSGLRNPVGVCALHYREMQHHLEIDCYRGR